MKPGRTYIFSLSLYSNHTLYASKNLTIQTLGELPVTIGGVILTIHRGMTINATNIYIFAPQSADCSYSWTVHDTPLNTDDDYIVFDYSIGK